MIDKDQLREAIAQWKSSLKLMLDRFPDAPDLWSHKIMVEAARLVAEGREVWWCEEHDMKGGDLGIGCLTKSVWREKAECRMVRMILIDGGNE